MLQERRKRTLAPVEYNLVKLSEQQHQYSEPKHMGNLQTKKPKRKKSTAITPHSLASSTAHLAPTILQLPSATTPAPPFPPRWYTQQYMLFLALREAEGHPLTRGQVISRAIELNQEIAQKRGFPLLFKGKTPRNTCSRLLTENKQVNHEIR